jgi:hypothetical protein
MKNIQANILAQKEALNKVLDHHMMLKFKDDGARYMVTYPEGMCLGGCRVHYSQMGKIKALQLLLEKMDLHWKESGIS